MAAHLGKVARRLQVLHAKRLQSGIREKRPPHGVDPLQLAEVLDEQPQADTP